MDELKVFSEEELVDMAMKEAFQVCRSSFSFLVSFPLSTQLFLFITCSHGVVVCRIRNFLIVLNSNQKADPILGKLYLLCPHMCILS